MIITISIAAFIATMAGGLFAMRFKDKLHLIMGFSAGAVVAVAFFDLIPEAVELSSRLSSSAETIGKVVTFLGIGFFSYMILDRLIILHSHASGDEHMHESRAFLGAGSLSVHSFIDGIAIGLAFQVSYSVGIVVAIAVLVHDFSDGINTVGMILKNGGDRRRALKWLAMDAVAPVLGIISTQFFTLSASSLGLVLSVFAGFFLYIGASDLLPESHHNHPTIWTTFMTLVGALVLYTAINIAGI
jgi:ZIP family zinc transporter